jgi:succinate dehydrogenase / fumarate reductase cytochrome b subunit
VGDVSATTVTKADRVGSPPHRLRILWRSTIGKKYVAAVTGAILAVWVVLHMLGNLKSIEGPGHGHAAIDAYARFLRTAGSPVLPHDLLLWVVRIVVLSALVLHIAVIAQLWVRNQHAKPREFRAQRVRSTIWARTMPYTGVVILGFLIFHILMFTTLTIQPAHMVKGHVYANMYGNFHEWWVVVVYVIAVSLLGFHINHGLWSGAQTAGIDSPDRNWFWRRLASGVTLVTVIGFALVPILFGLGALPQR